MGGGSWNSAEGKTSLLSQGADGQEWLGGCDGV